ncbi:MAG: hypothetical protein JNL70_12720 [Saprospiraceae bacterium]|nr:hypothetical protein [Saprospiraceae bacterium]
MMLKRIFFITICFSILSCDKIAEKDFSAFTSDFVRDYALLFPDETPLSIKNDKLSVLALPTPSYFDSLQQFHQQFSTELKQFDVQKPDFAFKQDAHKANNILQNIGIYLNDYKQNPKRFNVLHGFKRILETPFASDDERLQILLDKLISVPTFYELAKRQLSKPKHVWSDEAVEQHIQTFLFFDETLPNFLNQKGKMTPQYAMRLEAAKLAVKDYIAYVESFKLD